MASEFPTVVAAGAGSHATRPATGAVAARYNAVALVATRTAEGEYFLAHTALTSRIGPDGRHIGDFDYDTPPERIFDPSRCRAARRRGATPSGCRG